MSFDTIEKDAPLPTGSRVDGVTLHFHENVTLRGSGASSLLVESTPLPGSGEPFLLRMEFDGPVVAVRVGYTGAAAGAAVVLRVYDDDGQVVGEATGASAPTTGGVRRLRIDAPSIASATVRLAFTELHEICALTEARVCAEEWGEPVAELHLEESPSPSRIRDLLEVRLGGEVRNHYVRDLDDAEVRYRQVPELLSWLHALVDGDPGLIADPDADPHLRTTRARREGGPLAAVYPQAMLLLAALDPNVARILSLGWVDPFRTPPQDPHEDGVYDYKVTARWDDRELCGLVLGLGATESPRPRMSDDVTCRHLPGVRWEGTDPLRRVGVSWPRPPVTSAAQSAVRPVLFQVVRRASPPSGSPGPPVDLTARRAALVPADSWDRDDVPLFVDPEAPLGTLRYEVAGIDLFGQVSEPVGGAIDVKDVAAPPPPVRVAASLLQPGYPWLTAQDRSLAGEPARLDVRFEYGAAQLRRAPDASSVSLYWRDGSLVDSEAVTVNVRRRELVEPDRRAYLVDVPGMAARDLDRFVGGVLTLSSADGNLAPVEDRRRARIAARETDLLRLAPSVLDLEEGADYPCVLVTDPRNLETWTRVRGGRVELQPPIAGELLADAEVGRSMTVRVGAIEQPTRGTPLPADAPADVSAAIGGVEALVDRALLEPNLFAGSDATGGAGSVSVLASTGGLAFVDDTPEHRARAARIRLDLDGGAPPAPGGDLDLQVGLAEGARHVRYVEITYGADPGAPRIPGGQLAFEVVREGQPTLAEAEVVSDIRRAGNRLGFLVRFPESLPPADWPKAGDPVRYFRPYALEGLTVAPAAGTRSLRLPILPEKGTANAYLALATKDLRGNEGALSTPAQVTLVRAPPAARPSAPFPCSDPSAAEGFASPPDSQGRATVCLEWTHTPDPADTAKVRFEVGRALDQTIVATDRRNWLIGRAAPGIAPAPIVVTGVASPPDSDVAQVSATLSDIGLPDGAFADGLLWQGDVGFALVGELARAGGGVTFDVERADSGEPEVGDASLYAVPVPPAGELALAAEVSSLAHDADRGIYRASVEDPGGGSLASVAAAISGGCLIQDDNRFQVTRAAAEGDLVLLLRPVGDAEPAAGACTLEPPPDYSRVVGSVDKLRLLADKEENEDAFGLVTGVPIEATRLRDEVPGIGLNAFLYRARAVDPANNRSAWSPTSGPFWQVDTTPPDPPRDLTARPGDRAVELRWKPSSDPGVTEYAVYRADGAAGADPALTAPTQVPLAATSPARPTVIGGNVMLPRLPFAAQPNRTVVRPVGAAGPAPNVFVAESAVTRLAARRVEGVNPYAPEGTRVRVLVGDPASPTVLTHQPGTERALTVASGSVDLRFGLSVASIEAVVTAALVGEDLGPAEIAASPFRFDLSDATVDLDALTVSDLSELADGMAVVAIVRLTDDTLTALRQTPGTAEPMRVRGGELRLDLAMPLGDLLAVEPVGAPARDSLPRPAEPPDLRLTRPSRLVVDPADDLVTGVADLNPLTPDGTAVWVSLMDTESATHEFDGDPTVMTWLDIGLEGGRPYEYHMAAVKRPFGASPSAAPVERTVRSRLAGPVSVVALDRSEAEPPVLVGAEWVDGATGAVAQPDTAQPAVRLSIQASAATTAWVRVQRAPSPEGPWTSAAAVPGPGWQEWPPGLSETALVDEAADPSRESWFRAQLRTTDDRASQASDPDLVEALRPGSP